MPEDLAGAPLPVSIEDKLALESPRLNPRPVPLISTFIVISAFAVYFVLLWPTFFRQNLAAWSVGIAYILYDTFLLFFTASRIAGLRRAERQSLPASKKMHPGSAHRCA